MWIQYYQLMNEAPHTAIKTRSPTIDKALIFFKIPKSTIVRWTSPEVRNSILYQNSRISRREIPTTFVCMWPEMEKMLWETFMVQREQERPVRDRWFRRNAKELWKTVYPELWLMPELFFFSHGWFHGFLAQYRIVLRFVTNMAQSLPENHKQQILQWLRFN